MCLLARTSRALITVALAYSLYGRASHADDGSFVANILNSNDNAVLKQSIQHFVDNNTFPDDEQFITRLAPVTLWARIAWAQKKSRNPSSTNGNAPMITRICIWSEAGHFRRWALRIRRSPCLRWHCGPQSTSSRTSLRCKRDGISSALMALR
jgi:hypothetical protein